MSLNRSQHAMRIDFPYGEMRQEATVKRDRNKGAVQGNETGKYA